MRYSRLRRRSVELVRELDRTVGIPRPLDIDLLLSRLEQRRQRPIELLEVVTASDGPCGMWIEQGERDVILCAAGTSPLHQTHIIAHEIGHMIAGHRGDCKLSATMAYQMGSTAPDATLIKHMLGRSAYGSVEELEAEMIASLICFTAAESQQIDAKSRRLAWIEEMLGS